MKNVIIYNLLSSFLEKDEKVPAEKKFVMKSFVMAIVTVLLYVLLNFSALNFIFEVVNFIAHNPTNYIKLIAGAYLVTNYVYWGVDAMSLKKIKEESSGTTGEEKIESPKAEKKKRRSSIEVVVHDDIDLSIPTPSTVQEEKKEVIEEPVIEPQKIEQTPVENKISQETNEELPPLDEDDQMELEELKAAFFSGDFETPPANEETSFNSSSELLNEEFKTTSEETDQVIVETIEPESEEKTPELEVSEEELFGGESPSSEENKPDNSEENEGSMMDLSKYLESVETLDNKEEQNINQGQETPPADPTELKRWLAEKKRRKFAPKTNKDIN